MPEDLDPVFARLPEIRESLQAFREMLLANLVMVGEIPSPTFGEERRVRFLRDRFAECGLQNASTDEVNNAVGVRPGADGDRNILLVAHTDTVFDFADFHPIEVRKECVIGPGVGDNSLGVAVLATLPTLLDALDVELRSNLVLLGSTRSLGRGDQEGIRFFLNNAMMPIQAGLCVEGVQLGRLSYASLGMVRAEIRVEVPEEYDWTRFGARGAIRILNDVINRINEIPLPQTPRTSFLFGSIHGGQTFGTIAHQAALRFEIHSESSAMVRQVRERIEEITAELAAETGAEVVLDVVARRHPGGVGFGHPLVRIARAIMEKLDIDSRVSPSSAELAMFIRRRIPAVTLGITTGQNLHEPDEEVSIPPMFTGLTQLIGVLLAMDTELPDDD